MRRGSTETAVPRHARRGLSRIASSVYSELKADRSGIVASGVAFRVVIALFPAGALLTWLAARLLGADGPQVMLDLATGLLPRSASSMLQQAAQAPLASDPGSNGHAALGLAAPWVGILLMLWSANGGMRALVDALNVIFDREERRGFILYNLMTLGLTCGLLAFVLVAVTLMLVGPSLISLLSLDPGLISTLKWLRWPVLFLLIAAALSILYRYAPYGQRPNWPSITVGSVGASLLLVVCSGLFTWFTTNFASLGLTYGSLSTIIAFMLWLWLSFFIVLVGAQLDAVLEQDHQSGPGDRGL